MQNNKGITLIALIITIIVMLILSAVAISLATGDSGIIKKAGDAAKYYSKAEVEEKTHLELLKNLFDENGNYIGDKLSNADVKKIVNNALHTDDVKIYEEDGTVYIYSFEYNDDTYVINLDWTVSVKINQKEDILQSEEGDIEEDKRLLLAIFKQIEEDYEDKSTEPNIEDLIQYLPSNWRIKSGRNYGNSICAVITPNGQIWFSEIDSDERMLLPTKYKGDIDWYYIEALDELIYIGEDITITIDDDNSKIKACKVIQETEEKYKLDDNPTIFDVNVDTTVSVRGFENLYLEEVTISASNYVGCGDSDEDFDGCENLRALNITSPIIAFPSCQRTALSSITIPETVRVIVGVAFEDCYNLNQIIINKPEGSISGAPWRAPNNPEIIWNP